MGQPLWVKPRRAKSSYYRVKMQGDITKTQVPPGKKQQSDIKTSAQNYVFFQEFIAAEVLKLYGLTKDQSQKTDWQKMLKFGRKKRDRVDQILVGFM